MIVDVSVNGLERFECRQSVGSFGISNVAGMPDFVNRFEKFKDS
jgi:hypothetical protein